MIGASGVSSANVERITAANSSASVGGMVEGIDPVKGQGNKEERPGAGHSTEKIFLIQVLEEG